MPQRTFVMLLVVCFTLIMSTAGDANDNSYTSWGLQTDRLGNLWFGAYCSTCQETPITDPVPCVKFVTPCPYSAASTNLHLSFRSHKNQFARLFEHWDLSIRDRKDVPVLPPLCASQTPLGVWSLELSDRLETGKVILREPPFNWVYIWPYRSETGSPSKNTIFMTQCQDERRQQVVPVTPPPDQGCWVEC